jgi:hypothetical protein
VTIVEVLRLHKVDYDHFVRDIQLAERRDHYHLLRECRLFDRYCACDVHLYGLENYSLLLLVQISWNRARVDRISNTCKRKEFEPGAYVFKQGDEPDFVYILYDGSVDIIKEVQIVCKNRQVDRIWGPVACDRTLRRVFILADGRPA